MLWDIVPKLDDLPRREALGAGSVGEACGEG